MPKEADIWVERRVKDRFGNTIRIERVPLDEAGLDEESFNFAVEQAAKGGKKDYAPRRVQPRADADSRVTGG